MNRKDSSQFIHIAEQRLGYEFSDRKLLLEALTHKSYYHENQGHVIHHNERLEFLGDSVVGLVVVEYLFRHETAYAESVLAKIKSYIVSEPVLSEIAGSLSLGEFILLGKGEKSTGGRTKKSILSDAFEAVIGAIYLDGGFERAREVVLGLFRTRIETAISSGQFFDYKTELQEKTQMAYGKLPEYRIISQSGEEHQRIFTIGVYLNGELLGISSGRRKKEAESLAAKEALGKL
ncbi:MAG TPA: ribonuclease III [Thermodesulfovibrionales bacterium]|nr:ribonuclease III [Thermodesulfovibrionales bacterium]